MSRRSLQAVRVAVPIFRLRAGPLAISPLRTGPRAPSAPLPTGFRRSQRVTNDVQKGVRRFVSRGRERYRMRPLEVASANVGVAACDRDPPHVDQRGNQVRMLVTETLLLDLQGALMAV